MTTEQVRLFDNAEKPEGLLDMPAGYAADDSVSWVDSQLQALGREMGKAWQDAATYYVKRCKRPLSVVLAAVWRAYQSFDSSKANVQTYLRRAILNELAAERREAIGQVIPNGCGMVTGKGRLSRAGAFNPASVARLDAENFDDDGETTTLHDVIGSPVADDTTEQTAVLLGAIDTLPDQQKQVIRLRYGLETGEKMTLAAVAPLVGCTLQRVAQIETKALAILRQRMTHANS